MPARRRRPASSASRRPTGWMQATPFCTPASTGSWASARGGGHRAPRTAAAGSLPPGVGTTWRAGISCPGGRPLSPQRAAGPPRALRQRHDHAHRAVESSTRGRPRESERRTKGQPLCLIGDSETSSEPSVHRNRLHSYRLAPSPGQSRTGHRDLGTAGDAHRCRRPIAAQELGLPWRRAGEPRLRTARCHPLPGTTAGRPDRPDYSGPVVRPRSA